MNKNPYLTRLSYEEQYGSCYYCGTARDYEHMVSECPQCGWTYPSEESPHYTDLIDRADRIVRMVDIDPADALPSDYADLPGGHIVPLYCTDHARVRGLIGRAQECYYQFFGGPQRGPFASEWIAVQDASIRHGASLRPMLVTEDDGTSSWTLAANDGESVAHLIQTLSPSLARRENFFDRWRACRRRVEWDSDEIPQDARESFEDAPAPQCIYLYPGGVWLAETQAGIYWAPVGNNDYLDARIEEIEGRIFGWARDFNGLTQEDCR